MYGKEELGQNRSGISGLFRSRIVLEKYRYTGWIGKELTVKRHGRKHDGIKDFSGFRNVCC